MKILTTGGGGFIGLVLVNSLLENGEEVTILDNFSNSSKGTIEYLKEQGAKLIIGDINNYDLLKKEIINYDIVVHLAAKIDVNESILNPQETYHVNVEGTNNLLKACASNDIKGFIAASSASVYGEAKTLPLCEDSPILPLSPYGKSKVMMEKNIQEFSHKHNLNSVILRFFNIYGPGQNDAYAGVITKFLNNISKNEPLIIFGDGNSTRDFIHISDVVQAIHLAINNLKGKRGDKYNIATSNHVSIKQLANLILSISKKSLEIKYSKPREGDIIHSQTKIEKAKNELGFKPRVNLSEGLKSLINKKY